MLKQPKVHCIPCDPSCVFLFLITYAVSNACYSVPEFLGSDLDESLAVYIRYNGSVSAQYNKPGCGHVNIPAERGSTLYVGVYPLWDSNPLFFNLVHTVSEDCNQINCPFDYSPTESESHKAALSYDGLQYLFFQSADYVCYKDGMACGSGVTVDPYYVRTQLLDLQRAAISRVDKESYVVHGDEKSWISNSSSITGFDRYTSGLEFNGSSASRNHCSSDEIHFTWYSLGLRSPKRGC